MGIDEVKLPVGNGDAGPSQQFLEEFYRRCGVLDGKEFADAAFVLSAPFQDGFVDRGRKQVYKREMRDYAAATDLLMTTEGHLPSRKGDENDAAGLDVFMQV